MQATIASANTADSQTQPELVLASTSPYRKELLSRLGLAFSTVAPLVDETPLSGESPVALAQRLALAKATNVAQMPPYRACAVLGSDQVAEIDGAALGKPLCFERALAQLQQMRGKTVFFHSALALVRLSPHQLEQSCATVKVRFRDLQDDEIIRYLHAEAPYDCAGSAKSEGLGISLLAAIDSDDPTALVGLPLIRCCSMLRKAGFTLP